MSQETEVSNKKLYKVRTQRTIIQEYVSWVYSDSADDAVKDVFDGKAFDDEKIKEWEREEKRSYISAHEKPSSPQ